MMQRNSPSALTFTQSTAIMGLENGAESQEEHQAGLLWLLITVPGRNSEENLLRTD
jgi:hypothetical protein